MAGNWLLDVADTIGTNFNLPQVGLSELLNGGNRIENTRFVLL